MSEYYKVVNNTGGRLSSAMADPSPFSIRYIPGKWVKACDYFATRGYHLLVFNHLGKAESFYVVNHLTNSCEIWSCAIKDKVNLPKICHIYSLSLGLLRIRPCGLWPIATVMAKEVKLIERIHPNEEEI